MKDNMKEVNSHFRSQLVSFRVGRSRNRNLCLLLRMMDVRVAASGAWHGGVTWGGGLERVYRKSIALKLFSIFLNQAYSYFNET